MRENVTDVNISRGVCMNKKPHCPTLTSWPFQNCYKQIDLNTAVVWSNMRRAIVSFTI